LEQKKKTILSPIKRMIIIVTLAIFAALFVFIYLQKQSSDREFKDKQIINIFGKQRMYTQRMSKDANLLYMYIQSFESVNLEQDRENSLEQILELKESIWNAKENFAATLASMDEGYLYVDSYEIYIKGLVQNAQGYLHDMNAIWDEFDDALTILLHADGIDQEVKEAITFINQNNKKLLSISDEILNVILAASNAAATRNKVKIYIVFCSLTLIQFIGLFHIMQFIVLPFNRIYQGIADIGLASFSTKHKFPTKKRVVPIVEEINDIFIKFNDLKSLIENINNNGSFMETLDFINRTFSNLIPYNYIGIALFDEDKKVIKATHGVSDGTTGGLPENLVGKSWPVDDTSLGRLTRSGRARIINDLEAYTEKRPLKPYNKVILDAGIRASITLPLNIAGEPIGVIFFSSTQKNVYKEEHLNILRTLANSIAISFHQNIFIDDVIYSSILALAKLAEARDEDTGEHLERMKNYSRAIAEFLFNSHKFDDIITLDYIEQIERYSPLHDIGKVGIRDGILLKPGKLTPEEFSEMKKHTTFGAEVLRNAEQNIAKHGRSLFGMGIDIALNHHEKWDGTGYPNGKRGEEIPLCARIVAVADVFDALTSKRAYKEAYSLDRAFEMIKEGRGKHFDPVIVDAFMEHRDEIEKMYWESNTGVA